MTPELQTLDDIVRRARTAGASGVEVLRTDRDIVRLTAPPGGPTGGSIQRHAARDAQLSVRLWRDDGRAGRATGPADSPDVLVQQALAAADRAQPDPLAGPIDRFTPAGRGLGIEDPRHVHLRDEDREEVLVDNLRGAASEDSRIRLGTFVWEDERTTRAFVNSRGVAQRVTSTVFRVDAEVFLDRADPPIHLTDRLAGRSFADVACLPWGASLARRALALAGPRVQVEGPVRVLLPPRATARLVAWLADRFSHDAITRGDTLLTRNGGLQISPRLHLLDDGTLGGGLRSRGFDDRGVLPVPLALIREGRVAAHLLTPEQARALDLKPTGHVIDGRVEPTNLVLNAGLRTINALLSDLGGDAVEVDDLPDLSGLDEATGDLSLPFDGFLRRADGHHGVVRGARLVGNLMTALRQIAGIASDTDRVGHVDAPALLVDGFEVVSAG